MPNAQPRSGDPLHKAIGRLIVGLEKRDRQQQERRRYRRFNFGVKVHLCSPRRDGTYDTLCEAWAMNISMGGIGCLLDRTIDHQDIIYISFEGILNQPCYIPLRVTSTRVLFGNVREMHGEFVFNEDPDGGERAGAA